MAETNYWGFSTKQLHAGGQQDETFHSQALPIYQTACYQFRDSDHAAALFSLEEPGYMYSRLVNPTHDRVEKTLASLDNAAGTVLVGSGQAAEAYAILNIASAGDHIVSSAKLYGGTYNLFARTLRQFGIEVSFIDDQDDLQSWSDAIQSNTVAFFAETISNPRVAILDTAAIAQIAHQAHIPLIVDNTVATPYLLQAGLHGADVIVYSTTKFLNGHGVALGGAITDMGTFDWKGAYETHGHYASFVEPDESYAGLIYNDLPVAPYATKVRLTLLRDMGAVSSPFNAFLLNLGLETLSLRMQKHSDNALAIAQFLEKHPAISCVHYSGLESSPWYERVQKNLPRGCGALVSFELSQGYDAAKKFVNDLRLFSHVANIGDARSLVIHPASTTHAQLNEEEMLSTGVNASLVRLSVGIEDVNDLVADIENALRQLRVDKGTQP